MNILVTTPTYPPFNSGLGNAVQQQVVALSDRGCSVVVATGGGQRAQRHDPTSGVLVEEFNVRGADSLLQPLRGDIGSYSKFLKASRFDVIVMNAWQTWSTDLVFRNISEIKGRKYLYSNCISTNLFHKKQPVRSGIRYLAWRPYWMKISGRMRALDGVIFVADQGCDSRFDDLRLAQKLAIPHVIIPNAFSRISTAKEAPSGLRNQLIAVGSYDWFKGHDFALRAYALSRARNKIPLKIFGQRFTGYTDHLRSLASDLGLIPDYVTFSENTGKGDLLEEYRRSNLMISGSHTECQPLVLLDAMAAGTPFIARACGCIPFLRGGAAVRTETEAARAMDRILGDNSEWERLSREGRLAANTTYHPDVVGGSLLAFLTRS